MPKKNEEIGLYNILKIEEIVDMMKNYTFENAEEKLLEFYKSIADFTRKDWELLQEKILLIDNDRAKVVILWSVLKRLKDTESLEKYVDMLLNAKKIEWNEKYFIWYQINRLTFTNNKIENTKIVRSMYSLYHQILSEFKKNFDLAKLMIGIKM